MEDSQKIYEREPLNPDREKYLKELAEMLEDTGAKSPFGVLEEQEIKQGITQASEESRKILNDKVSTLPKKIVPIRVPVQPIQKNESKPVEITAGQSPISDIEKEVMSITRKTPLTPDQIINTILRNKGEGDPRSGRRSNLRIRINRALESLLDRNLLKSGENGTFMPAFGFIGGSDRSEQFPSRTERVKESLANGASWVEDIVNKGNIEGIDSSGEAFLGQLGLHPSLTQSKKTVDDASQYNTEAKVDNAFMMHPHMTDETLKGKIQSKVDRALMMDPRMAEKPKHSAYEKVVTAFNNLIHKYAEQKSVITKLKTFFRFKVDGETIEDIIKNLPLIEGVVSPSEYSYLMQSVHEEQGTQEDVIQQQKEKDARTVADLIKPYENKTNPSSIEAMMKDGIRIGAENWAAQNLEDAQGNKLPLTPENYIRSVGGVINKENTELVKYVLDLLVKEGLGIKTETGYQIIKTPRITKNVEKTQEFEVPGQVIDELEKMKETMERPAVLSILIYSLRDKNITKEQAELLIKTSDVLDDVTKENLSNLLNNTTSKNVYVQPSVVPRQKTLDERVSEAALKAQRIDISQNAARQFLDPAYQEPAGPITQEQSENIEKELSSKLEESLKNFAAQEALRKEKIRASKKVYEKIMTELGVPSKRRPDAEGDIDQAYLSAKKEYIDAGRALRNFIARRHVEVEETTSRSHEFSIIEKKSVRHLDVGVMEQFKKERDALTALIAEAIPEKEKGIIAKSMDKWARLPVVARVALSSAFFSLVSGGVGGFAATASMRAARGLTGVMGAKLAGSVVDKQQREKMLVEKEKALKNFATIDDTQQDEKIGDFEVYESEAEIQAKRDRLKKAALMVAAGGATSIGTGVGINAMHDTLTTPHASVDTPTTTKSSWWNKLIKEDAPAQKAPLEKTTMSAVEQVAPVSVNPVEVELSSKGFIDTIDTLKRAVAGQKLTPALEKLFAQSSQKIAIDLGLFKPGQVAESAFRFQGEQLAIDAEGNLSLVPDGSGKPEILMNSNGVVKPYAGKMFDADGKVTSVELVDTEKPVVTKNIPQAVSPVTAQPVTEHVPELKISSVSKESLAADTATTGASLVEKNSTIDSSVSPQTAILEQHGKIAAITSYGVEIAIPSPDFKNIEDIVRGKMPLKSEYQFSEDASIRKEYAKFFTRTLASLDDSVRKSLFDYHLPVQYKGGQIDIFQKGDDITVLLNGQRIGSTQLVDGAFGHQYEIGREKSIFSAAGKTNFELAFDEAKKAMEKNIKFFKLKK